jgi:uncharacterized phage-associated protein
MVSVFEVADYFILQSDPQSGDTITHLKLQKLIYYAQAWHLAIFKKPLFRDKIKAWAHGPVCSDVWNKYKEFGIKSIPMPSKIPFFEKPTQDLLDEVWNIYGQFSAKRLEEITHNESPWLDARNGVAEYASSEKEIPQLSMKIYYSAKLKHGKN